MEERIRKVEETVLKMEAHSEYVVKTVDKMNKSLEQLIALQTDQKLTAERVNTLSKRVDLNKQEVDEQLVSLSKQISSVTKEQEECKIDLSASIIGQIDATYGRELKELHSWVNKGIVGIIATVLLLLAATLPSYISFVADSKVKTAYEKVSEDNTQFPVVGVTTQYDKDGNVLRKWVKTYKDSKEPAASANSAIEQKDE